MKQIDLIKDFMNGKEKQHIKDIAVGLNMNQNSVRSNLNKSIKSNLYFNRLGGGYYELKKEGGVNKDDRFSAA
jgi:hypothetical protein